MDEQTLLNKLKDGDRASFKELFDKYQRYIFNICYRFTGNTDEAEDVTQNVFIKIFRSIRKFRGDSSLRSWIYRIAVNACLNHQRRKKLNYYISLDFLMSDKSYEQPSDDRNNPDAQIERAEEEKIVQKAVQSLPSRQKTAIILQRYEELTYREIAEVMQTTVPAVESLVHRARENLSAKLARILK